ncbi:hypothetical protein FQN50_000283 [Emmonsiellopsis sp. PD_5]|nr:hypothetical protein FQN50_000283 [Emmonsiellopsis sp. PD_5]
MDRSIGDAQDGYLDDVCAIFDRHSHPIVLVEQCAMVWMGIPANPTEYDFLVRDSQIEDILTAFIASGEWEQVEQDLSTRLGDPYVRQVPRLRRSVREPVYISLWPEKIYFLSVDGPVTQVPNVDCSDYVLIEEEFDPGHDHPLTKPALEARGTRIVPKCLAQRENTSPIFVPTITRMIEALLDQDRYRHEHARELDVLTNRPGDHISNFVSALYLERPHQQAKLLPHISDHNLSSMEAKLAGFKRRRSSMVLERLTTFPNAPPRASS